MTAANDTYRPHHHPDEEILMDYAAGAAHEGAGLLVATHLALCPACRGAVKQLEALGGALMADLPPSPLAPGSRAALMARLDEPAHDAPQTTVSPISPGAHGAAAPRERLRDGPHDGSAVPRPLRDYIGGDFRDLAWRRLGPGIDQVELPIGSAAGGAHEHMRLLRVRGGVAIPRHTHRGMEMVLVLAGGFRDGAERFQRGDFALSDQQVDHKPVVDADEDCVCLSMTDAPVRFTGFLGRILNLFVRF